MNIVRFVCCCLVVTVLAGCGSLSGAPKLSYNEEDKKKATLDYYQAVGDKRKDVRDAYAAVRLLEIDQEFKAFVNAVAADKQTLDSSTQLGAMALGIAGTLTGGIRAKANLAAGVTALSGTESILDKNFFREKSIDALVAAMKARRKEVLVRLLAGVKKTVDDYPIHAAIADLDDYYDAGTLNGAINFIGAQATASEALSNAQIHNYQLSRPSTTADMPANSEITDALGRLDLAGAQQVLRDIGEKVIPSVLDGGTGGAGARDMLRDWQRKAFFESKDDNEKAAAVKKLTEALKKAGVLGAK